jgi:1-acyl-sn-glycerol-3-phosphate acyltransferase
MLEYSDLPYQFLPPKPNRLVMTLAQMITPSIILPGKNHRLDATEITGAELFLEARRHKGARFVFLPNHPTHSDPQVMMEVCRQLQEKPAFMAAYDVFARGKLANWIMQRIGAFSVDREGSDRKSMKCSTEILTAGEYPLVIFPEGNVYLCNDRVTPFAEGAAYIALRAQKELGSEMPVFAVPVSLKYSYVEDVREQILIKLSQIAGIFGDKLDREAPVVEDLKRISISALAHYLKEHGQVPPESNLLTDDLINNAAEQLIESLEQKMELSTRDGDDLTARIRKIRATIHSIRCDPDRHAEHDTVSGYADEAMLALRILGYLGSYTASNPTLDRVAETITRLREDVTSKNAPPDGKRRASVQIGKPIDLREYLEQFQDRARGAITELTDTCENAVQTGINELNENNALPGSMPF